MPKTTGERLLSIDEVLSKLAIGRSAFFATYRPLLEDAVVLLPGSNRPRYLASAVEKFIAKCHRNTQGDTRPERGLRRKGVL